MPSQATVPLSELPQPIRPDDPQPPCDYPTRPMPELRAPRPQPREDNRPPLSRDDFAIIE